MTSNAQSDPFSISLLPLSHPVALKFRRHTITLIILRMELTSHLGEVTRLGVCPSVAHIPNELQEKDARSCLSES